MPDIDNVTMPSGAGAAYTGNASDPRNQIALALAAAETAATLANNVNNAAVLVATHAASATSAAQTAQQLSDSAAASAASAAGVADTVAADLQTFDQVLTGDAQTVVTASSGQEYPSLAKLTKIIADLELGAVDAGAVNALLDFADAIPRSQRAKNSDYIDLESFLLAGAVDNTAKIIAAITAATITGKGIRCGSRGEIYCAGSINFSGIRNIDIASDIRTDSNVIFGGFSNSALPSRIRLAKVTNGTSIFSAPPASPIVKILGLKNGCFEIGDCNYMQLYADSANVNTSSNAYNDFYFNGRIKKLELAESGAVVSWNNENRFWGGRLYILSVVGINYRPNHNKFINNTFEGADVNITFSKAWTNQIYGARFEDVAASAGVSFDADSMQNTVIQTWSGSGSPRGQFTFTLPVTDLGADNICTTESAFTHAKTSLFSVNGAGMVSDGVNAVTQQHTFGRTKGLFSSLPNFTPSLGGFSITANRLISLTDIIPVGFGDVVGFNADYDGNLLRPIIYCYDANRKIITDVTAGPLVLLSSSTWNGTFYSTAADLPALAIGVGFSIARSDVKYIQVTCYSSSTSGFIRHVSAHIWTQNLLRAKTINAAASLTVTPQLASDVIAGYVPVGFSVYNTTTKKRNSVIFAYSTTLSAGLSGGATSITLTAATGVKNGDIVGIDLDDGTTHWSKVSGLSGSTHTITALPSAAAINARVVYNRWAAINSSQTLGTASYASGSTTKLTYTIAGAAVGQSVSVSHNKSTGGLILKGDVSATDTVDVYIYNPTVSAIAPTSGSLLLTVE